MALWEYRAYDAELNVHEGQESANSFVELALKLRQSRQLQVLEATKLNQDDTLAAQRLAKMKARIGDAETDPAVETERPVTSAIRTFFSWFIPPFLKRSNDSK